MSSPCGCQALPAECHADYSQPCAARPCCSPFVCNCDHGWAEHKQVELAEAPSSSISGMLAAAAAAELDAMQTVQRGGSNANG